MLLFDSKTDSNAKAAPSPFRQQPCLGQHPSIKRLEIINTGAALAINAEAEHLYLNGKMLVSGSLLRPGDEIDGEHFHAVIGATPQHTHLPRILLHEEFRERMEEELSRSERQGTPTSLLMLQAKDIDLGAIRSLCRAGDWVSSWATDTAEICFPNTDEKVAAMIQERLLEKLSLTDSISQTVTAPRDGDTADRLIRTIRRKMDPKPSGNKSYEIKAIDPNTLDVLRNLTALCVTGRPLILFGEQSSGKVVFARHIHESRKYPTANLHILRCTTTLSAAEIKVVLQDLKPHDTLVINELSLVSPTVQDALAELIPDGVMPVTIVHLPPERLKDTTRFSKTLMAKLWGESVRIPSLCERPEDIIPLAKAFIAEFGGDPTTLTAGAAARLLSYAWPGNVLEMQNTVERALSLSKGDKILAEYLPLQRVPQEPSEGFLRGQIDFVERDAIMKSLTEHNFNQTHAAKRLGISRRALIYKMEKYGLKTPPAYLQRKN